MKKLFTKNIIFGLGFIFIGSIASAQNGLEGIIVEKYYVSNAADSIASAAASAGSLNIGATTYRIFADMLPGYNFEMAYGNANHPLKINTTTSFYNNIDRGSTNPSYSKVNAAKNTVMLDSWLSVGAACAGNFGILKSEDNGVSTVVHPNGVLANNDPNAGIPLTTQDGLIAVTGRTPCAFSTIGDADSAVAVVFDTCQACNSFTLNGGSWYILGGAVGPDSTTNKVLIAQVTTNGTLTFELNIQLGTPSGGVENYVANNPTLYNGQMEITIPSLVYNSGITVSVENKESASSIVNVYPNPAEDILAMEIVPVDQSTVNNSYSIYDLLGKVIAHKELGMLSGRYFENINISSLHKGIYFMTLTLDGVTSTKKIIKN